MNKNTTKIKRYPYCGFSHNLLELFMIIGYDSSYISNELFIQIEIDMIENNSNKEKNINKEKDKLNRILLSETPSILNVIASDFKKKMINLDNIIDYLFPSPLHLYYTDDSNQNINIEKKHSNYIFQLNSTIDNMKMTFNAYCYKFYEQYYIKQLNQKAYIPKCFVILSQYQLFGFFNRLCKEIQSQFNICEIEIPLEIQLYNIINFIPAPVLQEEILSLFCNKTLFEYSNKNEEEDIDVNKEEIINQISGYPFYDINISKIFTLLNYNEIIRVFILIFLEKQMNVFYSKLELLNLFMLILTSFNFLLDTMYNWHVISVGEKELKNPDSHLIGKPNNSILGFNFRYNGIFEKLLPNNPHFSLDLNEGNLYFFDKNNKDKRINKLRNYLDSIINKNSKKNSGELEFLILKIISKIKDLYGKLIYGNDNSDFFFPEDNMINLNKKIQILFYDFYIDIFAMVYPLFKIIKLEKPNKEGKYYEFDTDIFERENIDLKELNLCEDEENFIQMFLETFKFYSYMDFIFGKNQLEMLQTIQIIFDELIVLKFLNKKINIDYIYIFDILYIKAKKTKIEKINFHNFYVYYKENLQKFFEQEIVDSEIIEKKIIEKSKKPITYKYNKIDLDSSIINKYMHLLNKIKPEELENIFPSLKIKNTETYIEISENLIPDIIEASCIEFKQIELHEIIIICVIIIFILFIEKYDIEQFKNSIIKLLSMLNVSFRKNIFRIMNVYYELCIKQIKSNNYSLISKANSYVEIFETLLSRKVLPNPSLLNLIEKILSLYDQEKENIKNHKSENDFQKVSFNQLKDNYNLIIQDSSHEISDPIGFIIEMGQACFSDKFMEEKTCNLNFVSYLLSKNLNSKIYSPIKLLIHCNQFYKEYIKKFSVNFPDNYDEIIINLIFFFENIKIIPKESHNIIHILLYSLIEK